MATAVGGLQNEIRISPGRHTLTSSWFVCLLLGCEGPLWSGLPYQAL